MKTTLLALAATAALLQPAAAQSTTVTYSMAVAGLPIGSATMTMTPNGGSTSVSIAGRAGGPLEIGRLSASAVIAQGRVTAQSQSGSGKDASSANLVSQGNGGSSSFTYSGVTSRGPGKLAMAVAGGRVSSLENSVPDNPKAVRAPITEAHKSGIVDPLMALSQVIKPGGTIRPDGVCGRSHQVFTGITRFNLTGTAAEDRAPVRGMPEGWRAVACRVTLSPVAGHRIDKGNQAQARTATVVFAANGEKAVLWSLSVPVMIGSFSLTASSLN